MSDQDKSLPESIDPIPVISDNGERLQISPKAIDVISRQVESRLLTIRQESYSGPFPHPRHLEHLERIVPGSAKQIVEDFMAESTARRSLEKAVVESEIQRFKRGQWFGFVLASAVLVLSFVLLWVGRPVEGFAAIVLALAGIAGAFLLNKLNEKPETEKK